MKKTICIILVLAMALTVFSGCQKSPESPIIVGKNMDEMVEKAKDNEDNAGLAEQLGDTTHITKTIDDGIGSLSAEIDADVLIPQSDSVTIMKVGRTAFTQEMTDRLVDTLMHGQMYKASDVCIDSKDGYTKLINTYNEQIMALEEKAASTGDENVKAECQGNIDNIRELIKTELEPKLEAAPESPAAIDSALVSPDENQAGATTTSQLWAMATDNGCYETLSIINCVDNSANQVNYAREADANRPISEGVGSYFTEEEIRGNMAGGIVDAKELETIPDVGISEQQAISEAGKLLEALGIEHVAANNVEKVYGGGVSVNENRCLYRVSYARAVGGITETRTLNNAASFDGDLDNSVPSWAYEDIEVYVDQEGIAAFHWISPYAILDTAVENAKVLSFDEIMSVFQKMLFVKYAAFDSASDAHTIFHVTRIEFGLARINYKDDYNSALLVPVWDFFGYPTDDQNGISQEEKLEAENNSLLTVNAIDGSIIDRSIGY